MPSDPYDLERNVNGLKGLFERLFKKNEVVQVR